MPTLYYRIVYEVIHLARTHNFPKNQLFLLSDTRAYMYVSEGRKC